jgi:nicotinamidase/pyrazinamidase
MKKILIVVDYQYDFVDPSGALPVPNADTISQNIQDRIDSDDYEKVIYTFDTHTPTDYEGSAEQKLFPNIHCEFRTEGWNFYKIKPKGNDKFQELVSGLEDDDGNTGAVFKMIEIENEYFFTKNVFNIWEGNISYPKWFETTFPKDEYVIDVVGVATNYCVFMNVMGMIERGYKVNIISDAVEGIKVFPDGTEDESFTQNNIIMRNRGVSFI